MDVNICATCSSSQNTCQYFLFSHSSAMDLNNKVRKIQLHFSSEYDVF